MRERREWEEKRKKEAEERKWEDRKRYSKEQKGKRR